MKKHIHLGPQFIITLIYLVFINIELHNESLGFKILSSLFLLAYVNIFFLAVRLIIFAPLAYVLGGLSRRLKKLIWHICDALIIMFAFLDCFIFSKQGLHIYDRVVINTLTNSNFNKELNISYVNIVFFIFILLVMFAGKEIISKFSAKFLNKKIYPILIAIFCLLTAFSTTAYISKHESLINIFPLYPQIKGSIKQAPLELSYDYSNELDEVKEFTKKNVILVMAESLRNDYFNEKLAPKTHAFFKENNCFNTNGYSGGHTTEYGVFSALAGVYAFHYQDFSQKGVKPFGPTFLKSQGYKIYGGSASQLFNWNNAGFLFKDFDEYKEFSTQDIHLDDQVLLNWLLEKAEADSPFFTFAFFNSTHHNYFYPEEYEIYKPVLASNHNYFMNSDSNPEVQTGIVNRYKNSVFYSDSNLEKLFRGLKEKFGDNIIIAFTGDHGEEFWEEGLFGHGKTSYINPRTHVPLWFCGVGENKRNSFSHHTDIFPTIFEALGLNDLSEKYFSGYSVINGNHSIRPPAIINGPLFPYKRNKAGIITHKNKFWLKKGGPNLFDFFKYRTTNLNDENILDGSDKEEYESSILYFKESGYRFLRPHNQH